MASLIPAEFLGVSKTLGSIAVGKRACLTLVDNNFNVQATLIDGQISYTNKATDKLFIPLNRY